MKFEPLYKILDTSLGVGIITRKPKYTIFLVAIMCIYEYIVQCTFSNLLIY